MSTRKEDQARLDGMAYALKRIKAEGVEAFEKELAMRGRRDLAIPISQQDIVAASQKIKEMTFDTIMTLAVAVLHDEWQFGKKRCKQFTERFNLKAACLKYDLVSWDDYTRMLKDELDLQIDIRLND